MQKGWARARGDGEREDSRGREQSKVGRQREIRPLSTTQSFQRTRFGKINRRGTNRDQQNLFLTDISFYFFRSYYYSPVLLYLFLFSFSTGNARPPKDYKACLAIKTCCLNPFHGRARIHQGKKQKDFVLETISLGKLFRSLSYLLTLNFPDVYLFSYLIFTFSRLLDS